MRTGTHKLFFYLIKMLKIYKTQFLLFIITHLYIVNVFLIRAKRKVKCLAQYMKSHPKRHQIFNVVSRDVVLFSHVGFFYEFPSVYLYYIHSIPTWIKRALWYSGESRNIRLEYKKQFVEILKDTIIQQKENFSALIFYALLIRINKIYTFNMHFSSGRLKIFTVCIHPSHTYRLCHHWLNT